MELVNIFKFRALVLLVLSLKRHLLKVSEKSKSPSSSQREIANSLGLSLGKINYCLKALKSKGLVKIQNFNKSKNKMGYAYILTPRGISEKTKITINFMKRKMKEYDELKKELKKNK